MRSCEVNNVSGNNHVPTPAWGRSGSASNRPNGRQVHAAQPKFDHMSNLWSEGYFTASGYTYGYYRETSPVFQRFCLLLRGWPAAIQARARCIVN